MGRALHTPTEHAERPDDTAGGADAQGPAAPCRVAGGRPRRGGRRDVPVRTAPRRTSGSRDNVPPGADAA